MRKMKLVWINNGMVIRKICRGLLIINFFLKVKSKINVNNKVIMAIGLR